MHIFIAKLPRNLMPHIHVEAGVCEKIFRSAYSTVDKRYFTLSFKRNTFDTFRALRRFSQGRFIPLICINVKS